MTIIKHGAPNVLNSVMRFECPQCGCVFEANFCECKCGVKYGIECGEYFQYCECPECGCVANEVAMRG